MIMERGIVLDETIDLRELLSILRRNLLYIIIATLVASIIGMVISMFFMTPIYEASATMIVNKSEKSSNPDLTYNDILLTQKLVKTYSVIMQSNTVLNRVINELGLDMDANKLRSMLSVSSVNDTEVIKIVVSSDNPALAADIANEITRQAPSEIIRAVKAGSVEVIDPASVPVNPVKPNKAMNTAIAGILGAMLSIGVIFLKNYLDDTIKSEEDIRDKIGLPVLGVLPVYRPDETDSKRKKRGEQSAQDNFKLGKS